MNILVIGKNGQLGRHLQKHLSDESDNVTYWSRADLDMAATQRVYDTVMAAQPDVIINASAYTDTQLAEVQPGLAYAVNGASVGELARAAKDNDVLLIHVSTDYVFDGDSSVPYVENAANNPQNVYGASKLLGEELIQSIMPKYCVLRTSWVFSEYGKNFAKTIVRLAAEKDTLQIVADQQGCPTFAGHLAQVIVDLTKRYQVNTADEWRSGLWHYADQSACSWYDFATAIVDEMKQQSMPVSVAEIESVSSADWPSPIKRPQNSALACQAIMQDWGIAQYDWRMGLRQVIGELAER